MHIYKYIYINSGKIITRYFHIGLNMLRLITEKKILSRYVKHSVRASNLQKIPDVLQFAAYKHYLSLFAFKNVLQMPFYFEAENVTVKL